MPADTPHPLDDRLRRSLGEVAATQDPAGDWDVLVARHRQPATPMAMAIGTTPRPRRPRVLAVAAVVLVVVALAGAALVATRSDDRRGVTTAPTTTSTAGTSSTSTTTTAAPPAPADGATPTSPLPIDLPYEDLPDQGLLTRTPDGTVHVLDLDGELLATTTSATFVDPGPVVLVPGTIDDGAPTVAIGQQPAPRPAPGGCEQPPGYLLEMSATTGDVSTSVCGVDGDPEAAPREIWITRGGETSVLTGAPPDPSFGAEEVAGHWVEAVPSPDGRWVLGQWSGECESPSSWLVPTDGRAPIASGSASLSLDGDTVLESGGLGWAADGRAIVRFTEGICGTGIPGPGIYAIDPDTGEATVLVPDPGDGDRPSVWLWSKGSRNPPELRPQDRDAARYSVEQLLTELRAGDAAGAGRFWDGWSDRSDDHEPGSIDALESFAADEAWLLADPDPDLSVVASFGWTVASPVVVVTVDVAGGGRRSAAFVVGGEVAGEPRQVLGLPGDQVPAPAAGTPVHGGDAIVVDGTPIEGGARAYVDGMEVPVEVDDDRQTTTITLPDALGPDGVVVTLTRATPELPEAMAWWFPVDG